MILPLLLSFASAAPAPAVQTVVQSPAGKSQPAMRREAFHEDLLARGGAANSTTLGGGFTAGGLGPFAGVSRTFVPGVFRMVLDDPGTGWVESLLVGVPQNRPFREAPLLVMFHSYDVSEWDCYLNSPIFQDALDRGWYVVAPLGAHQVNFGIPYSQVNIQYALDLVIPLLPVDHKRIYGLGFSMGGGTMMTYAASHQDPAHARFAALINHTGGVSIANTYYNSTDFTYFHNPLLFGGPPTNDPFLYSRSSVVDIDYTTNVVDPSTDLARNLAHIPVLNEYAINDPLAYLKNQTQVVYAWLQLIPGMETFVLTPNFAQHHWSTIDSNTALNWLYSKTLKTPKAGEHRVLADRDATWFHFYVQQDSHDAFTPFRWNLNTSANRLTIDQTENLKQIDINSVSLGLNTAVNVELVLGSADGGGEIATVSNYNAAPQQVLRNGVADNTWTWSSVTKRVTIVEPSPAGNPVWKIRP